jgi:hypothetical protein
MENFLMVSLLEHQDTFQELIKRFYPYVDRKGKFRSAVTVNGKVYESYCDNQMHQTLDGLLVPLNIIIGPNVLYPKWDDSLSCESDDIYNKVLWQLGNYDRLYVQILQACIPDAKIYLNYSTLLTTGPKLIWIKIRHPSRWIDVFLRPSYPITNPNDNDYV